jgi:hypothetical protein
MRGSKMRGAVSLVCLTLLLLIMAAGVGLAAEPTTRSNGQTIYAAAYSYVLMGTGKHKYLVTSTLVIRNIDPVNTIIVTTADYRDSSGGHLRHYVEEPVAVGPLASIEFVVQESDVTGGHSPSFIVRWRASTTVIAPVVESLVIGGRGGQGVSFVGRAWVTEEAGKAEDE